MSLIDSPTTRTASSEDEKAARVRGSADWYQALVDYYFDRREKQIGFWDAVEAGYRQRQFEHTQADRAVLDEVRPGRIYSMVHTIEAMVFNRRPKMFLKGYDATAEKETVPPLEEFLNNEWQQENRIVRETRLCIRDCTKTGWGIMLSSYETDEEIEPEEIKERADAERLATSLDPAIAAVADQAAEEFSELAAGLPPDEERTNFEADDRVVIERINSRRVSPRNFLIDPDATCLEDAKWVGRVIIADIEAVKSDPLLKNTDELEATAIADVENGSRGSEYWNRRDSRTRSPHEYVTLYEIFERVPGKGWRMVVIARGHEKVLRTVDQPYWIGCPYRLLRWNEDGEDIFAQSDVLPVYSEILAERILMTKSLDGYSREQVDTTFYSETAGIDPKELNAAGDPEVGKYVKVNSADGGALQNLFYKLPKDAKSPEAMNFLAMLERQFQMATGIGPNQFGQALKSETSASEAMEIAGFSRARGSHKFGAVEEFVAGIARDRMGLMAQFYGPDKITQIAGPKVAAALESKHYTIGDAQSGLRVHVEPGSMRPVNDESRYQQYANMLGIINTDPIIRSMIGPMMPEIYIRMFRALGDHDGSTFFGGMDSAGLGEAYMQYAMIMAGGGANGPTGGQSGSTPNATSGAAGATQQNAGAAMGGMGELTDEGYSSQLQQAGEGR